MIITEPDGTASAAVVPIGAIRTDRQEVEPIGNREDRSRMGIGPSRR